MSFSLGTGTGVNSSVLASVNGEGMVGGFCSCVELHPIKKTALIKSI